MAKTDGSSLMGGVPGYPVVGVGTLATGDEEIRAVVGGADHIPPFIVLAG